MAPLLVEIRRLSDIAVVRHRMERAVALRLEVTPLTLQFANEVFLVALKEFPGAIRATHHRRIRQQTRLLIHGDHQFGILNAIEVALEIIGVRIIVSRNDLLEPGALQCRYEHRVSPLQGHIHHRHALHVGRHLAPAIQRGQ